MPEFTCGVCQRKFNAGEFDDNSVCDECQDERPGLAHQARMAGDCEPLTPEEEAAAEYREWEQEVREKYFRGED